MTTIEKLKAKLAYLEGVLEETKAALAKESTPPKPLTRADILPGERFRFGASPTVYLAILPPKYLLHLDLKNAYYAAAFWQVPILDQQTQPYLCHAAGSQRVERVTG